MQEIKEDFSKIGAEVKNKLETADAFKKGGLVSTGIGLGVAALGIAGALFTGGASLIATAAAVGGGGAAACGGLLTIGALISEHLIKSGGAEKLKEVGNKFKKITEPMAKELAEICSVSVKWEQNSADVQTEVVNEYRDLIRRVKSSSTKCNDRAGGMQDFLKKLVDLISKVLEKTSLSAEEGENLAHSIIKSGSKCGEIISDFEDLKKELVILKEKVQQLK